MNLSLQIEISQNGRALADIGRFRIAAGRITFLFGESGIGKTILSKALFGLLDPAELSVRINQQDYREFLMEESTRRMRRNGFFVFQEPSSHLNPLLRLEEQLNEGSLAASPGGASILRHLWEGESDQQIRSILQVYPKPYRPSGGEKQRILLAMAFKKINLWLNSPPDTALPLFIFDEPSGSLDNRFRNLFLRLLIEKYRQRPFTALVITHDYSIIGEIWRAYPDLREEIVYQELLLRAGHLQMQQFSPQAYLKWLRSEKPLPAATAVTKKPLLRMAGGYQVFGKKMQFKGGNASRPLGELQIHPGEIVYLKAPSGAGKTSLAKIIMGLLHCRGLDLEVDGHHLGEHTPTAYWKKHLWARKLGMVFQHADEALNLNAGVRDVFTALAQKNLKSGEEILGRLREIFDKEVDASFLNKKVAMLSGGQKQRLNLLRTLVLDTDLIILDEPLNGLDFLSITRVLHLLQEKQAAGKGILIISHNEEIIDAIVSPESVYFLAQA